MKFMREFHTNGVLPRGSNSSFITLIPKVENPQGLGKFRPISLVGCMYKIVAKVLTNRLKKVLPRVIDKRQNTLMEGMNLLHSVVVANEVVDKVRGKRKRCLIFKVDYEKAYNLVSWDFLLYMLHRLGFLIKWILWINECLCSSSISILANGSSAKEFNIQRGLRQGNPLSPFLFIVIVEGLNGLMRMVISRGIFKGYVVGNGSVEVKLLQ